MADKEISELTAATTPLAGDELIHIDQDGNSRKVALSDVAAISTGAMLKSVYDPNDDGIIAVAQGGSGAATAAGARTNYGLGTMAVQNAGTVAITGGSVTGITDITVADGGTGASDASGARTNLELVYGVNVQAWSANLDGFAATTVANVLNRVNHTGTQLADTISDFGTAADLRITAAIGSTVQAWSDNLDGWSAIATSAKQDADALLTSVSALSLTAGDMIYATGADAVAVLPAGANGQVLALQDGVPQWGTELVVGGLLAANNLSDVASAATTRTNLDLGEVASTAAVTTNADTVSKNGWYILGSPFTGGPTATFYQLQHQQSSTLTAVQIARSAVATYSRFKSGGVWGAWTLAATTDDISSYGATVDGTTNDEPAVEDMLAALDYARLAPGTSSIGASVAVGSNQTIVGVPGVTKLTATNAVGNGIGVLSANDTSGARFDGIDLTVPSGFANQLRGILGGGTTSGSTDLVINNFKGDFQRLGTYPIAMINGNINGFTLGNFDITSDDYLLWKPNISAPTSNTYQGYDGLVYGGRFRGQGSVGGRSLFSADGNFQNLVIGMVQAVEVDDTVGSGGFAVGFANDGAITTYARGAMVIGLGARDLKLEAIHVEDAIRGLQAIGVQSLDCDRGAYVIANAQGRLQMSNWLGYYVDTAAKDGMSFVDGGSGLGPQQINIAFPMINDWAQDGVGDHRAIEIAQTDAKFVNIIGAQVYRPTAVGAETPTAIFNAAKNSRIAYGHIRSSQGYGIGLSSPDATVLIESNNSLSGATLGPIDPATISGCSGDQYIIQRYDLSETPLGTIAVRYFRRNAVITRASIIFEEAATGTSSRFIQMGKGGVSASTFFSHALGTTAAQWTVQTPTLSTNLVSAGDILTLTSSAAGDGDYTIMVQINYFEYD